MEEKPIVPKYMWGGMNLQEYVDYLGNQQYELQEYVEDELDGKMTNPMTAQGDIIYGSINGAPARLPGGVSKAGKILSINVAGVPAWVDAPQPEAGITTDEASLTANALTLGAGGKKVKNGPTPLAGQILSADENAAPVWVDQETLVIPYENLVDTEEEEEGLALVTDGGGGFSQVDLSTRFLDKTNAGAGTLKEFNGMTWVNMPKGNAGQVLTSTSSGLAWDDVSGGEGGNVSTDASSLTANAVILGDGVDSTSGNPKIKMLAPGTDGKVLTSHVDPVTHVSSVSWDDPQGGGGELPDIEPGDAGKVLAVNEDEDGVEWVEQSGGGGDLPEPGTGDAGKAVVVNSTEDGYVIGSKLITNVGIAAEGVVVGADTNSIYTLTGGTVGQALVRVNPSAVHPGASAVSFRTVGNVESTGLTSGQVVLGSGTSPLTGNQTATTLAAGTEGQVLTQTSSGVDWADVPTLTAGYGIDITDGVISLDISAAEGESF